MLALILGALTNCSFPIFGLPGYITGLNAFPAPLSAEEETLMLKKCREGEEDARNKLIEHNLRLVAHIAKKYSTSGKEQDDLISIGTIGLIKSIDSFNPEKGTRLATYAARCIENEVLMVLRAEKRHVQEVSLQEPIGVDKEGNAVTLIDKLSNEAEPCILDAVEERIQLKKILKKISSILKTREKTVIELRYGLNQNKYKTQREIAEMFGISRSYVSRIEKKALETIKTHFIAGDSAKL